MRYGNIFLSYFSYVSLVSGNLEPILIRIENKNCLLVGKMLRFLVHLPIHCTHELLRYVLHGDTW